MREMENLNGLLYTAVCTLVVLASVFTSLRSASASSGVVGWFEC